MKSSNIGGQAVIEGVMMKNKDRYAVAVRKPDGEIEVTTDTYDRSRRKEAGAYGKAFDDADDGCIFCTCNRYFYGTSVFFVRSAEEMDFFLYSSDYH